jgi:hypothetical protein
MNAAILAGHRPVVNPGVACPRRKSGAEVAALQTLARRNRTPRRAGSGWSPRATTPPWGCERRAKTVEVPNAGCREKTGAPARGVQTLARNARVPESRKGFGFRRRRKSFRTHPTPFPARCARLSSMFAPRQNPRLILFGGGAPVAERRRTCALARDPRLHRNAPRGARSRSDAGNQPGTTSPVAETPGTRPEGTVEAIRPGPRAFGD